MVYCPGSHTTDHLFSTTRILSIPTRVVMRGKHIALRHYNRAGSPLLRAICIQPAVRSVQAQPPTAVSQEAPLGGIRLVCCERACPSQSICGFCFLQLPTSNTLVSALSAGWSLLHHSICLPPSSASKFDNFKTGHLLHHPARKWIGPILQLMRQYSNSQYTATTLC